MTARAESNRQRGLPDAEVARKVDYLLSRMTLEEKLGQMTMVENNSITPAQVAEFYIGSVLSGGGGNPTPNTPANWRAMVCAFQKAALETRLAIPLLYGVDAVHGHNNVKGAVIFPHNIGLGASRDPDLVERIGQVTARELLATSVHWTFAPSVSVPQDLRWGRTYEGYSEDSQLVAELGAALTRGLGNCRADGSIQVLACAKHYVADGAAQWRESPIAEAAPQQGSTAPPQDSAAPQAVELAPGQWRIDQGDAPIDEASLRATHLPPYQAAIAAGARTVMASYSSWDGEKLHAHRYLLRDLLKGELGFQGFVVTDWMAINQLDPDYQQCVVQALRAGIDMVMVPYDFRRFIATLKRAVEQGDVAQERIDDAVRRILRVKLALGLFDQPIGDKSLLESLGRAAHRQVAREALRKSLVLLKNERQSLPLSRDLPRLLVAGRAVDDIGLQCGGWSITWQGEAGATTSGTTILEGLRAAVADTAAIEYSADGQFAEEARAAVGIVALHEEPYAEGFGDRADLSLAPDEIALLRRVRERCDKLIVLLIAGRPRILTEQLPWIDALVAAWLPGSEADGIADVLFGDYPFTGKLPFSWPRSMDQIPLAALRASADAPLWEYGYGLTY
ncbi:MAG: glycoside hydrolase family 3 C-terminal domain-containing protein [Chloroflexota bacterium]|nr:glycoside hydrolase family 3 C-terminal domain-containing protein [Chloroflexota bacterium]